MGLPMARRSCCCMGFHTPSTPGATLPRPWRPPAAGSSCRICAAMGLPGFCRPPRRDPDSRRPWGPMCGTCWTGSTFAAPCLPATIGAVAAGASRQRCGPSASPGSLRSAVTTSRISLPASGPGRPRRSTVTGINTTSILPGAKLACGRTGATSSGCFGSFGRLAGRSTTRPSTGLPWRSTIRTGWTWFCNPTVTASATPLATRRSSRSKRRLLPNR